MADCLRRAKHLENKPIKYRAVEYSSLRDLKLSLVFQESPRIHNPLETGRRNSHRQCQGAFAPTSCLGYIMMTCLVVVVHMCPPVPVDPVIDLGHEMSSHPRQPAPQTQYSTYTGPFPHRTFSHPPAEQSQAWYSGVIVVGEASPPEPSRLGSTPRQSKSRLGLSQGSQCSRHALKGEDSPPGFFVCDSKLKWINQNKRHIIRSPTITAIPKGRNPTSYNATCQTAGCRHVVLWGGLCFP